MLWPLPHLRAGCVLQDADVRVVVLGALLVPLAVRLVLLDLQRSLAQLFLVVGAELNVRGLCRSKLCRLFLRQRSQHRRGVPAENLARRDRGSRLHIGSRGDECSLAHHNTISQRGCSSNHSIVLHRGAVDYSARSHNHVVANGDGAIASREHGKILDDALRANRDRVAVPLHYSAVPHTALLTNCDAAHDVGRGRDEAALVNGRLFLGNRHHLTVPAQCFS
mmetsp:Transcript_9322/g.18660  ORF Transcript_9322/g.18660 Transcript_9322/m.18660 type:complete len:222 (+) Transcript_9322:167-832(+)